MGNSMKKGEVQVVLEGCPGSGKSSALFRLKKGEMLLTPTPGGDGFFVENFSHLGSVLNVWEVHSETVREKCLSTARALCFVVDCQEDSDGIDRAKAKLHATMSAFASQTSRKCFTVLVLANKQDAAGAMAPGKLERALGLSGRSDSKTWRWKVQGCSATQGSGLREGMDWLATAVRAKRTRGSSHRRIAKSASRLLVEAPVA